MANGTGERRKLVAERVEGIEFLSYLWDIIHKRQGIYATPHAWRESATFQNRWEQREQLIYYASPETCDQSDA